MTEELLIELGFVKNDYDFYYNYTKGDILSCDSDKTRNGKWYVMYDLPNNNRGVITNKKILKQLLYKLYGDN